MEMLLVVGEAAAVSTTLAAFLEQNGFEPEERAEIVADVEAGGLYTGGGGAAPLWTLGAARAYSAAAVGGLIATYQGWCALQGLPSVGAEEQDPAALTPEQRRFLQAFVELWDQMQDGPEPSA